MLASCILDGSKPIWNHLQFLVPPVLRQIDVPGPQLKGTLSFANYLMGSTISDNLAENLDK